MGKKRSKKKKRSTTKRTSVKTNPLLYVIGFLTFFIISATIFFIGYYTAVQPQEHKQQKIEPQQHSYQSKKDTTAPVRQELKKVLQLEKEHNKTKQKTLHKSVHKQKAPKATKQKTQTQKHVTKKVQHKKETDYVLPLPQHYTHYNTKNRPKLAIIIDDVQTASDVRAIKRVGIVVTMSFLPPRSGRPYSAKLAQKEPFYMVHLPLEALHFHSEEPLTLHVGDSLERVQKRIALLKEEFPRVHYINNHTGSKYTSDVDAMRKLLQTLKSYNIHFIDSRTIGGNTTAHVMNELGMRYVARDIFLDHHHEKNYIKNQIRKAIALAKKRGVAVAIGHPHKTTLQALREMRSQLRSVELIQVNQLYR